MAAIRRPVKKVIPAQGQRTSDFASQAHPSSQRQRNLDRQAGFSALEVQVFNANLTLTGCFAFCLGVLIRGSALVITGHSSHST